MKKINGLKKRLVESCLTRGPITFTCRPWNHVLDSKRSRFQFLGDGVTENRSKRQTPPDPYETRF